MPRITRKQQKIFAESATNNGVFGSLQASDPTISSDPDTIQGRPAFANGWDDATYSAEKLPPLEEFQALQYLFSRQLAYLFQDGIGEWNASTTYYKGGLVKTISGTDVKIYSSLVDNNTNNQTTDTTKWSVIIDTTNPFVHIAGTETITGNKDFTGTVTATTQPDTDSSTKLATTEFVQKIGSSSGNTPRDKTTLFTGSGSISTNRYLQLSESWQNFEELVFVGASTSSNGNMVAFRISTYWLDELLTAASSSGDVIIWSNYIGSYLEVAGYTASTPSTTSDLYVNGHVNGYLQAVYGINRKPTP